jgi:hypothetical protein
MKKLLLTTATCFIVGTAAVANAPITGTVESRCSIITEVAGVYGNPSPHRLSTAPYDGGVRPRVRTDVVQASAYKVIFSWPTEFSSSPALADSVAWDGDVVVSAVSATEMSAYESEKIQYNNHTEYLMEYAGSTWFEIESSVEYGAAKSFPGGQYSAVVVVQCIPT